MGKQRHDVGAQKRRHHTTQRLEEPVDTAELARELVRRGLASGLILEGYKPSDRPRTRKEDRNAQQA